uniref:Divalent-cation tolerance protein CutA n=1 Tax=Thermosporothrix sp. COM3 TaxID=2490863 RepID=A0A455SFK8_9CHLR|nr:divalent-cation tolerance protein CutA [Thermosporothrix sp. COM3]
MSEYIVVVTTVDSEDVAKAIARKLVEQHLAACVHLFPIQSVYRWEGKQEEDNEWRLEAKTRRELYPRVEKAIVESHPYSCAQVTVLPIVAGKKEYLDWIEAETR